MLALLLAFSLHTVPPEPIQGTDLPTVTGPQAPHQGDLANGIGEDRQSLRSRRAGRRGTVPAVAVPADCTTLTDRIFAPSGWKAYRVQVPAKATLIASLKSERDPAFRVYTVNKWGRLEEGMLQNKIYKGKPEASYINPKDTPNTIYVIVDTTETNTTEPYTLSFSWK